MAPWQAGIGVRAFCSCFSCFRYFALLFWNQTYAERKWRISQKHAILRKCTNICLLLSRVKVAYFFIFNENYSSIKLTTFKYLFYMYNLLFSFIFMLNSRNKNNVPEKNPTVEQIDGIRWY